MSNRARVAGTFCGSKIVLIVLLLYFSHSEISTVDDTSESLGQTIVECAQRQEGMRRSRSPSPNHSTPKRHNTPPLEIPGVKSVRMLLYLV